MTYSIWRPSLDEVSAEARPLIDKTFHVFPLNVNAFLKAHLYWALRKPIKYLGTLCLVLSQRGQGMRNRFRALAHFGEGICLAKQMEGHRIRHVHASFAHTAMVALVISKISGMTFSFTGHAVDIFKVNQTLLPLKIDAAKFVITISEYNRKYLCEIAGDSNAKDKIHILHYGIDLGNFSPVGDKGRGNESAILSIGRLVEKKGFDYLIGACRILAEKGYRFRCQIVGEGPLRGSLQSLIDQNGLGGRVELVGSVFQERIKDYLGRADIFALPCVIAEDGDRDGIPNVLIEAMAMEIPVISTQIVGIPELITDGVDGLLVKERDEGGFAKALMNLLDDGEVRHRLGKSARKKVMADFNLCKTTSQLSELFKKVLE
jgi:colanic acid/amylovoran biosynthesis glycosyltransferase